MFYHDKAQIIKLPIFAKVNSRMHGLIIFAITRLKLYTYQSIAERECCRCAIMRNHLSFVQTICGCDVIRIRYDIISSVTMAMVDFEAGSQKILGWWKLDVIGVLMGCDVDEDIWCNASSSSNAGSRLQFGSIIMVMLKDFW